MSHALCPAMALRRMRLWLFGCAAPLPLLLLIPFAYLALQNCCFFSSYLLCSLCPHTFCVFFAAVRAFSNILFQFNESLATVCREQCCRIVKREKINVTMKMARSSSKTLNLFLVGKILIISLLHKNFISSLFWWFLLIARKKLTLTTLNRWAAIVTVKALWELFLGFGSRFLIRFSTVVFIFVLRFICVTCSCVTWTVALSLSLHLGAQSMLRCCCRCPRARPCSSSSS